MGCRFALLVGSRKGGAEVRRGCREGHGGTALLEGLPGGGCSAVSVEGVAAATRLRAFRPGAGGLQRGGRAPGAPAAARPLLGRSAWQALLRSLAWR